MYLNIFSFLFLYLLISLSSFSYTQELEGNLKKYFIQEVYLSFNRTDLSDENTINKNGFGFEVKHVYPINFLEVVSGLDFNHSVQFKKEMYESLFAKMFNTRYAVNTIGIPFGFRKSFHALIDWNVEMGVFTDLMISSFRKGDLKTLVPNELFITTQNTYAINEKIRMSNSLGFYGGISMAQCGQAVNVLEASASTSHGSPMTMVVDPPHVVGSSSGVAMAQWSRAVNVLEAGASTSHESPMTTVLDPPQVVGSSGGVAMVQ